MRAGPMWQQAYDAQMGLWRWYRTPAGKEWLGGLFRDGVASVPPENRESMLRMYDAEIGRLLDCDPVFVSADMCQLVDAARDGFQAEPLLESDLPTPRGFMWFAEPLVIHDKNDNDLAIVAASWTHSLSTTFTDDDVEKMALITELLGGDEAWKLHGPRFTASEADALRDEGLLESYGLNVALYSEPQGYLDVAFQRAAERGAMSADRLAKLRADEDRRTAGVPVVPVHLAPWHFGMTFDGNEIDYLGEPTGVEQWWRLLQTTFRLMQQKLAHRSFGRPDRPLRREAMRLGFHDETEVVIVRLRHEQGDRQEPSGEEANYSHRFIVGGHWRNQWYPSEQLHRQVYIAPYVKGPEDKPLIVRPRRVFQWTR